MLLLGHAVTLASAFLLRRSKLNPSPDQKTQTNMELVLALGIPVILFLGLTIVFMTDGIPNWVTSFNSKYSAKTWLYGVIALSTAGLIAALFRR